MAGSILRWAAFEADAPELAEAGRRLLFRWGPGLAYLATVRPDGAPRIHPVCSTIVDDGLWVVVGPSPKRGDLVRDGRYALHTFPEREVDDEFSVAGRAERNEDPSTRDAVEADFQARDVNTGESDVLFELLIERALHAAYGPRPSWPPTYTRWPGSPG